MTRYRVGDAVMHASLGYGKVVRNSGREVEVQYKNACGIYDRLWFEQYNAMLSHRRDVNG